MAGRIVPLGGDGTHASKPGSGSVTLISSDKKNVTLSPKAAEHSLYCQFMLEDGSAPAVTGYNYLDESGRIPVPWVSNAVLTKIAKFCEHYKDTQVPHIPGITDEIHIGYSQELHDLHLEDVYERGDKMLQQVPLTDWDRKFLDVDPETFRKLAHLAGDELEKGETTKAVAALQATFDEAVHLAEEDENH